MIIKSKLIKIDPEGPRKLCPNFYIKPIENLMNINNLYLEINENLNDNDNNNEYEIDN